MRFLLRLIGALVVLVGVALLGLMLLPAERIARIATDQFSAQTGRALTISGPVSFSLFPVLGIEAEGLALANAEWAADRAMFTADTASIALDAAALLRGDIRVTGIEARRPVVRLETLVDGRVNWALMADRSGGGAPIDGAGDTGGSQRITLEKLVIRDASLSYVEAGREVLRLDALDADLSWPGGRETAHVALTLHPAGEPVKVVADILDMPGLLAGKPGAMTAVVTAPGGTVNFTGRAGIAPEAAGRLDLTLDDTARFAAALGQAGIDLPKGMGRAITLKADMAFDKDQRLSLRGLRAGLDHNTLAGDADILLGARPNVTARLVAGTLDLEAATGGGGDGGGASGWSRDRIDASVLGALDGQIAFTASGLKAAGLNLGAIDATLTIRNARAELALRQAAAYDGTLSGKLIANNRKGFSARVDMRADGIEMQKLLMATAGVERLSGKGGAKINVLASGASLHDLMNSLDGTMAVEVGRGRISGIDLDKLLRGEPGGGTTVFDALTATGTFKQGVLSNDDLALDLPRVRAAGKGRIGVGARDINYLFTPSLKSGEGDALAVPVRIRGSWDNPKIRPDLESAVKQNFEEEIDKAKDEVRDKVQRRVERELGVTPGEGQSTEDAVKDKLESEAEKALRKLLGQEEEQEPAE